MRRLTPRSWLAWLAIAFGVLWAISNAQDINTVAETRHWPTTPGTIVAATLNSDRISDYGRFRRPIRANQLHVTYDYTVAARQYSGSRWNLLPPASWPATHAMLREYAPGREVVVHYDAHDPSSAVLDTSWPVGRYAQLACAILLVVGVWVATRRKRVTA